MNAGLPKPPGDSPERGPWGQVSPGQLDLAANHVGLCDARNSMSRWPRPKSLPKSSHRPSRARYKKAFDSINHGILLNKIKIRFGISSIEEKWFK